MGFKVSVSLELSSLMAVSACYTLKRSENPTKQKQSWDFTSIYQTEADVELKYL